MAIRQWDVNAALSSYRQLLLTIDGLSEEEVIACLDLEVGTLRRRSVIDRLTKRAIQLYTNRLQEKYRAG